MAADAKWLKVMQAKGLVGDAKPVILPFSQSTDRIDIELPMCPTTNNLFPSGKGRRRFLSPEYRAWKKKAASVLATTPRWTGEYPVLVSIVVVRGKRWKESGDVGNREKACTDALVENGIIESDDCLHVRLFIDYDETGSRKNPPYLRVRIRKYQKPEWMQ